MLHFLECKKLSKTSSQATNGQMLIMQLASLQQVVDILALSSSSLMIEEIGIQRIGHMAMNCRHHHPNIMLKLRNL